MKHCLSCLIYYIKTSISDNEYLVIINSWFTVETGVSNDGSRFLTE